MAITFTSTMKKVWKYLTSNGMTKAGAAGMMGNMYAESGIIANRVEILCLKRLKENGKEYTDKTYTKAVDNGKISRAEFLNPLPNKQYGYGLCQWTSPSRKGGLYDTCKTKGVSIGNVDAQLEYLIMELKKAYTGVWQTLSTTDDISAASDMVLLKFEIPGNVGSSVKKQRADYSKEIYNQYASTKKTSASSAKKTTEDPIQKVISIFKNEIGYLEKASNSQLDNKTANAGWGNYTKYWRDVYPEFQSLAWCAVFVSWCFMQAFGLEMAKKLLKHWPFTFCPTLASMTTNKDPKVGSIALFYRNGEFVHTGLVIAVTSTTITTIEGNTSSSSGIVANGGAVCEKTYKYSELSSANRYFMPDYSLVGTVTTTQSKPVTKTETSSGGINETPKWVGRVKVNNLNVRNWAGMEYPNIKSYPKLNAGNMVDVCDEIKDVNGEPWYFVRIANQWFGFVMAKYIEKV